MGAVVVGRRAARSESRNVLRGQQTRRRILDSARTRILATSFEDLRLDDLAADVGITKAAVVKSVGGKGAILLELGDEDRATRLHAIRQAMRRRTALRRRLADLTRVLFELDLARLPVVMAYVGYMWFWTGVDHDRVHGMVEETRELLCELIVRASPAPPLPEPLRILSLRLLGAYVIGLRDLRYGHATLDEAVTFVVDYCLDVA
ncbi:MAG TPA: TetR/AcrR family transcriptional regulator [Casimicrobiaceae bacterium]|nr:TetR/AcrR family transcriptional regulator [Casimicrobiaceae bacterium]